MKITKVAAIFILTFALSDAFSEEPDTKSEAYKYGEKLGEQIVINKLQEALATATVEFGISARTMNWFAACMIDANAFNDAEVDTEHCKLNRQSKINMFGEENIRDDNSVVDASTTHLQERFTKIATYISQCSEHYSITAYEFLDKFSISYDLEQSPTDIESLKLE